MHVDYRPEPNSVLPADVTAEFERWCKGYSQALRAKERTKVPNCANVQFHGATADAVLRQVGTFVKDKEPASVQVRAESLRRGAA